MSSTRNPILRLVLLGKTGQGKSSTGNSLLGIYRFEESDDLSSETKVVVNYTVDYKGCRLKVFDTPGFFDAEKKDDYEGVKCSLGNMDTLMNITKEHGEVIDAFLLVVNSQERYSAEDRQTIEAFENTFGTGFFTKHCIIVITKGDCLDVAFDDWLGRQTGPFEVLLKKCEKRALLVSNKNRENKTKDVANEFNEGPRLKTREDIINAVYSLKRKYPERYSHEDYAKLADSRYRMLLKSELEELVASFDEKLFEIRTTRKELKNKNERDELLQKIAVLRFNMNEKDNGTGMLKTKLDALAYEEELVPPMNSSCTIS